MNLSKSAWAQAHLDDSTMRNGEPKTVPKLAQKSTPVEGVFLVFCSQSTIFVILKLPKDEQILKLHQVGIFVILTISLLKPKVP